MERVRFYSVVTLVVMVGVAAGCNGTKPATLAPSPGSGGKASTPVHLAPGLVPTADYSDEEQADATESIGALVHSMVFAADASRRARAEAMAVAVRAVPQVADSGVNTQDMAWVRLKDGSPIVIVDDARNAVPAGAPSPLGPTWGAAPSQWKRMWAAVTQTVETAFARVISEARAAAAQRFALPQSKRAFLAQVDSLAPHASQKLSQYLTGKGYAVTSVSQPSLKLLRETIQGYGVFWISTHGIEFADDQGVARYGIVTGEPADKKCALSQVECDRTRADLKQGRAFRGVMQSSGKGFFSIGAKWVTAYWSFAPKAFVVLDACDSLSPGYSTQEFWNELVTAKANTIMGWIHQVGSGYAEKAMTFLFDRILGANDYLPLTPKQRPFSAPEVLDAMRAAGKDVDPNGDAKLDLVQADESTILLPSIRNLLLDEDEQKLEIFGEFGQVSGVAEISTVGMAMQGWSDTKVTATIAASGPSSKGSVVVKINGLESNPVPLTEWVGTFYGKHLWDGSFGAAGPMFEMNCSRLRIRADIHKFRNKPEASAAGGYANDSIEFHPETSFKNLARDSACSQSSSGQGDRTYDSGDTIRTIFSGRNENVQWARHDTTGSGWFFAGGRIKPLERSITLNINSKGATNTQMTTQKIAPAPMGPVSPGAFLPISIGHVGYEMSKRFYAMDGGYTLPMTSDSFAIQFEAPVIPTFPGMPEIPGGMPEMPPNDEPPNHGEIRWKLDPDAATVPSNDTPG